MRVVLAEHVADDGSRLLVAPPRHQAQLVHGVEDPAVNRLQAVTNVGKRTGDDDAHRIVDERLLHLLFDEAGQNTFARVGCCHGVPMLGQTSGGHR